MLRLMRNTATKILQTNDPPHKVAAGAALGMFIAITPTMGIQMATAAICATIVRVNRLAAVAMVWITNPYTALPIYWFNYLIGYLILGKRGTWVTVEWIKDLLDKSDHNGWWAYTKFAWGKMMEVMLPLWIGSLIVAIPCTIITYYVIYDFALRYSQKRQTGEVSRLEAAKELIFPHSHTATPECEHDSKSPETVPTTANFTAEKHHSESDGELETKPTNHSSDNESPNLLSA